MNTTIDIVLPSESFEGTRSQLLRWLKTAGQAVKAGEPLVEIETDKVTMELPAPASGVLCEYLKREHDELAVGDILGRIDVGARTRAGQAVPASAGPPAAAPSAPAPAPRQSGIAADAAGLPGGGSAAHTVAPTAAEGAAGPEQPAASSVAMVAVAAPPLSAAVRRLLAQHDLSAAQVRGSGAEGRITVEDVLRQVASRRESSRAGDASATSPTVQRVAHSAFRRRTAAHMVESLLYTAPHVTTVFEADLGAVLAHRAAHRAAFEAAGAPLTLTAYFLKACVAAIRAVPEANARWTDEALELYERIDIGVGTAVEGRGLIVPVIRDVATLDLAAVAAALADVAGRARTDRLTPADVRGGTFTISNHGVSGSLLAAPIIINQPQSAILGIGKLEKRAVVVERDGADHIVVRPRCYVTLTLDHRVMDGHQANRFLATWVNAIESWPA